MLQRVTRLVLRSRVASGKLGNVPQTRSRSYLHPPWLLDTHIPRYQLLTSVEAAKKRAAAYAHLRNCNLCPRRCSVNRYERMPLYSASTEGGKAHLNGMTRNMSGGGRCGCQHDSTPFWRGAEHTRHTR
ncbi:uncharacterized protein RCC_04385 [Ramularia collo-cygni]|uniref:Uncharacterized protein n=1 Tax=Ramularia collo-cygni TaxID=112498 RepID=A0A2D3URE1_9PEZI|nr:uncharacterized protein RCC_04385 [Ramularia collo-cygni]CZT18541.1 uncharacterized protein RCC_04385 [Ramularia collo-cygni]